MDEVSCQNSRLQFDTCHETDHGLCINLERADTESPSVSQVCDPSHTLSYPSSFLCSLPLTLHPNLSLPLLGPPFRNLLPHVRGGQTGTGDDRVQDVEGITREEVDTPKRTVSRLHVFKEDEGKAVGDTLQ